MPSVDQYHIRDNLLKLTVALSPEAGFESAGYGYGGYSPYGYNMSAGPGFYPGGYAAPPGYGYPQYGQPPVGGGSFQQGGGYSGTQPHLGGGSAGKYGGASYGEQHPFKPPPPPDSR